MNKQLFRIGTSIVNGSEWSKAEAFDLLFGGYHEFVYLPDFYPIQLLNGTWIGAFRHIIDGHAVEWKQYLVFQKQYL
jgi:hypothetical protein